MAQIYYDALGKHGAMGFMAFLFICQYLMGVSITVAASRQMWAFSRDGALPFSSFFRPIVSTTDGFVSEAWAMLLTPCLQSKTFGYIPLRTVWGAVFVAVILGLLCLIAPGMFRRFLSPVGLFF